MRLRNYIAANSPRESRLVVLRNTQMSLAVHNISFYTQVPIGTTAQALHSSAELWMNDVERSKYKHASLVEMFRRRHKLVSMEETENLKE
ncbi:hypothetical protein KM043_004581 [Ampulex compressa]|nr:hypothetical protein KM043_004581 [Ampulex compressa]